MHPATDDITSVVIYSAVLLTRGEFCKIVSNALSQTIIRKKPDGALKLGPVVGCLMMGVVGGLQRDDRSNN